MYIELIGLRVQVLLTPLIADYFWSLFRYLPYYACCINKSLEQ